MKISIFIYVIINILFVQLLALDNININYALNYLCIAGVATVGLSHGAIDDILYQKNNISEKRIVFIIKYLMAILLYLLVWILLPNLALVGFILSSSYHFGQAQLITYKFQDNDLSKLLNVSWGLLIISMFFYFNNELLLSLAETFPAIPIFLPFLFSNAGVLLIATGIIVGSIFIYKYLKDDLNIESILFELFLIGIVAFSFYLFDPFISFSLFFIIVHSVEALCHEVYYFRNSLGISKFKSFVKSLLPFTLLALCGIGIIMSVIVFFEQQSYLPIVVLILISCITAPHSIIMNEFYLNVTSKK